MRKSDKFLCTGFDSKKVLNFLEAYPKHAENFKMSSFFCPLSSIYSTESRLNSLESDKDSPESVHDSPESDKDSPE